MKNLKQIFAKIIGIEVPWKITHIELSEDPRRVTVKVSHGSGQGVCPHCGKSAPGYDSRERSWRHLDLCLHQAVVVAKVPRVACCEHGIVTVSVPWAEPGSRFTTAFEAVVISWLKEASILAVARMMNLSWTAVDGIMRRAVNRGLERRGELSPTHLSVDETSYRKGHDYITVVTDQTSACVIHVAEDRKKSSLGEFYDTLSDAQKVGIESVSMDMWPAYISATREALPQADSKIAFDRFHIARAIGRGLDTVRKREHKALMKQGDDSMKGSKYTWLRNGAKSTRKQQYAFRQLQQVARQTARAWSIKEVSGKLWHYKHRGWARKAWLNLINWMCRSRLVPMVEVSKMLRNHLWGIINAVVLKVTNAYAESMNSRIKTVKIKARGFRNKQRFVNAIYFHLGGLDLYPKRVAG